MTPEQAGEIISLLSDVLDILRACFAALAVGTGVILSGFIALFVSER